MPRQPQPSPRFLFSIAVLVLMVASRLDAAAEAPPKEAAKSATVASAPSALPLTAALKQAPAADFEATFLALMIHGSVMRDRLWAIAHDRATDDTIRTMENQTAKKAKIEIEQMKAWLQKYFSKTPADIAPPADSSTALALEVEELTKVPPAEFNARFAQKMIAHLHDAATMSRLAVQKVAHPEVKELARTSAIGHTKDYKKLQGIAKTIK